MSLKENAKKSLGINEELANRKKFKIREILRTEIKIESIEIAPVKDTMNNNVLKDEIRIFFNYLGEPSYSYAPTSLKKVFIDELNSNGGDIDSINDEISEGFTVKFDVVKTSTGMDYITTEIVD